DAIDDAAAGEITALNTRRWKYASFFNRMKRRIHQEWQPNVVYQRRDPRGNVYGTKDRVTLLRISLSPTGRVTDIVVARPSGVDFLDEEAIRAVRAAQPFPNPPQALVDERSRQIVFNFGFRFEITRGGFRIFRQR
ncbi:MAG: energy transducer TonB, partial [Myxococcota bacterium]